MSKAVPCKSNRALNRIQSSLIETYISPAPLLWRKRTPWETVNQSNNETNFHIPFSYIISKTHAQLYAFAFSKWSFVNLLKQLNRWNVSITLFHKRNNLLINYLAAKRSSLEKCRIFFQIFWNILSQKIWCYKYVQLQIWCCTVFYTINSIIRNSRGTFLCCDFLNERPSRGNIIDFR